jgi:acyl-CoA dehydrogenase
MDFNFSDEHKMIYEYGDSLAKTYDRKYWMECAERCAFPKEMYQQTAMDGFVGTMAPEEFGGAGLGLLEMELFTEGLANNGIPLLTYIVGSVMSLGPIGDHGTEEQKQRYLPDACAGLTRFCFAITEPDAGSNTMKATTIATKKPDGRYRLNGTKTFITDFVESDYALVVTRTTPLEQAKKKTEGFTLFIVNTKAKGIEAHPIPVSIPLPEMQYQLFFDDVDLGPEDILGEEGKGFEILFECLNPERVMVGAIGAGIGRFAMEKAVDYANDRVVFDRPIGAYQALQHPLAKAKTEIEMASLMTRKAAWLFDKGEASAAEANMAKCAAAEASIHAVDASLQCFGGNGFTKEYGIFDIYPMVRLFKTAPLNNEMVLNYIGEHVMGLPRSY